MHTITDSPAVSLQSQLERKKNEREREKMRSYDFLQCRLILVFSVPELNITNCSPHYLVPDRIIDNVRQRRFSALTVNDSMGPAVRKSPSRLWGLVRQKVFHKRPSTPSDQLTYLSDSLSTNEEICRRKAEQVNSMDSYSQAMMEKERKKMQALVQQRSDSTDVSYHSAVS